MNDKVQSILALVEDYGNALSGRDDLYQYDPRDELEEAKRRVIAVRSAIESAIREAIAAPGVAQGWVMVPEGATKEMIAAAWKVDWSNEDVDGTVHNIWNGMLAAAPSPTTEQHIQLHDPVTIKGGPAE